MHSSFTFLKVKGIPIGAHWSWLLVFGLILWSLSSALFPATYPGLDERTYLTMGAVTAVLFFASILLHELGHALQALKEGMRIEGITLWLFGGVAAFRGMFSSPGEEFRIAIAGPAVSVALAALFGGAALAGDAAGAPDAVQGVVDYLARINVVVVLFNLVPALPLDGGRVLRSLLWRHQRSFSAATRSAARAGKAFGGILALVGVLNFLAGGAGGGLWLVFLGWFLVQAAEAEAGTALVRQALAGRRVRDVMASHPVTVTPELTLEEFVARVVSGRGHSSYPVVRGDTPVGLMPLRRAGETPTEERALRRVQDAMITLDEVPVLSGDTDLRAAFEAMGDGAGRALVVDGDRLVGILSPSDVVRAVEFEQALGLRPEAETRRVNPLVWAAVALVMAIAAGALYHPPLVVLGPGPAIDVVEDISIRGAKTDEINGRYMLVSVRVEQPNVLGTALALLNGDEVRKASEVIPSGVDPEEFAGRQREIFRQSQQLAAAAGARAAGLDVRVSGDGAVVEAVLDGSPAAAHLRAGDVIVAIDGRRVVTAQDVQETIGSRPAGTRFRISIRRDERESVVALKSQELPEISNGLAGIGVAVATRNLRIDLPFEVAFEERAIGGPSAGLAYALAIADLLDEGDYAGGRTVAASGTVDVEGSVGPVGGLTGKTEAADDAGANVFLVPSGEVDQVGETDARVHAVESVEQALKLLRTTA